MNSQHDERMSIRIRIRQVEGTDIALSISPSATVSELKEKIHEVKMFCIL